MTLRKALDRTLRLMRDEVHESVPDETLLAALRDTRVALIADHRNIASHSAQTAFVTAAMLMARSGHQVYLLCPDLPLAGPQPPLGQGQMIEQLRAIGADLLPGVEFITERPTTEIDLAIALGDSLISVYAHRRMSLNAERWAGRITPESSAAVWNANWWPVGGMAAGALAAGEVFKAAMQKLAGDFRNRARLQSVFAPSDQSVFALAPEDTPYARDLGPVDFISGGAIVQAALFALARVPGVSSHARVIEPDCGDLTNLNRYMLLLRSRIGAPKADDLAAMLANTGIAIAPVPARFENKTLDALTPLAPVVLVGVDDVPSRWLVQRQDPEWLVVGATTHWSAMASFHKSGMGCAQCLHPKDEVGNGPIPTVAFVSFWAGLLTATYLLRRAAGRPAGTHEQQVFVTPFRAENALSAPVPFRASCPACDASVGKAPSSPHAAPHAANAVVLR